MKYHCSELSITPRSRDSSVTTETRLRAGRPGFDSRQGLGIFFRHRVQTYPGAHSASFPVGSGALTLGVKRRGHEADHSIPSTAEVKYAWSYISTLPYAFMAWCLVEYRDNSTFYLCLYYENVCGVEA